MSLLVHGSRQPGILATAIALALLIGMSCGEPLLADDFRVDTEIFAADDKTASGQTTTLFYRGAIYDFPQDGHEITILAPGDKARVVLLDMKRKLRTELTLDQLLDFSGRLREWAAEQEDGLLRFSVNPRFEKQADATRGQLHLASRWMTYELKTRPASSATMVTDYRRFCDIYAHLNTLLNPGSLPPFGRLELNRQLAQSGQLPTEIRLTIPPLPKFGNQEVKLSTRHRFRETLSDGDLAKIEEAGLYNGTYQTVSLMAYRGAE